MIHPQPPQVASRARRVKVSTRDDAWRPSDFDLHLLRVHCYVWWHVIVFFFVNSFLHIFEPGIAWMCHSQHVTSKAAELSCSFRSIGMFGSVPTVFYWTVNIWSPQQFDLSMSQYNPSVVVFAIAAKLLLTWSWWYHLFYTVLVFSQMLLVCCRTLQNNWLIIGWTLVDKVTTFCVITLNKKKDDTSQD